MATLVGSFNMEEVTSRPEGILSTVSANIKIGDKEILDYINYIN